MMKKFSRKAEKQSIQKLYCYYALSEAVERTEDQAVVESTSCRESISCYLPKEDRNFGWTLCNPDQVPGKGCGRWSFRLMEEGVEIMGVEKLP